MPKLPTMPKLPILPALLFLACCSAPTSEQQAALAAEGFYRHLVAGEYEQFLEGKAGADSLPEAYREQLLTGYQQFMDKQQRAHGGITDVRISNVRKDTLTDYTSVLLILCYGDSTQEEIIVPMVHHNGTWRIR